MSDILAMTGVLLGCFLFYLTFFISSVLACLYSAYF